MQLIEMMVIIRLHRPFYCVDAVYCYQPSSVVCRSVCLYVTLVIPAKTAEPIQMPFGLRTRVDQRKEPWGSRSPMGMGNFEGERGVPL